MSHMAFFFCFIHPRVFVYRSRGNGWLPRLLFVLSTINLSIDRFRPAPSLVLLSGGGLVLRCHALPCLDRLENGFQQTPWLTRRGCGLDYDDDAIGDLLRDGAGVLPTGRNMHALDPVSAYVSTAVYRVCPSCYRDNRTTHRMPVASHLCTYLDTVRQVLGRVMSGGNTGRLRSM